MKGTLYQSIKIFTAIVSGIQQALIRPVEWTFQKILEVYRAYRLGLTGDGRGKRAALSRHSMNNAYIKQPDGLSIPSFLYMFLPNS